MIKETASCIPWITCSVAQSCVTLCDPMDWSKPGFPVHHQLPKLAQTHVHWVSDAIQPSRPLSSTSPPAFNLYQHHSHKVAKILEFQLLISPSNEHPRLISFRMGWLDFLAVQGTLKRLLQHHSSKSSIIRCSAFFIVQLSHPYMTTGKTIAKRWEYQTTWPASWEICVQVRKQQLELDMEQQTRSK